MIEDARLALLHTNNNNQYINGVCTPFNITPKARIYVELACSMYCGLILLYIPLVLIRHNTYRNVPIEY